jgi:hypothetical protein
MLMIPKAKRPENAPEIEAVEKNRDILKIEKNVKGYKLYCWRKLLTSIAIADGGKRMRGIKQDQGKRRLALKDD